MVPQEPRGANQGRRCRPSGPSLSVEVEFLPAPGAQERLRRAYDLLMRAAALAKEQASPSPHREKDQL